MTRIISALACLLLAAAPSAPVCGARASTAQAVAAPTRIMLPPKFSLPASGLRLARQSQTNSFYDVIGRRSAAYGYEGRGMEVWAHPLKLIDEVHLSFKIEGYPLEFRATDLLTQTDVRPEATTFTYAHAAFTVRQIVYAPVDEPGLIVLLDVDSTLPMTIRASFRPRLSLAWPGGLQTGGVDWNPRESVYYLVEDSQRHVGIIGSPLARDVSAQPYQEEPRDTATEFVIEATPEQLRSSFIPIIIAGASTQTRPPLPPTSRPLPPVGESSIVAAAPGAPASPSARTLAKGTYDRLLTGIRSLYESNVRYYARLEADTLRITTPDRRFDEAFAWAKVGVDKGIATNPQLGSGLVAGFRTSGESERPGFAWFFGRDALWTTLALNAYGDFANARLALDFLKKFQRTDGKIPHEISQSAGLIDWFDDYPYAWASADATPLFVIVHADLYAASGDLTYLRANYESIKQAYEFTARTDTDGDGLIENTNFGHGWVEGGALYPPHEEIYMQGLFVEASRAVALLAEASGDSAFAARARLNAERTRRATEETYWLPTRNHYAYATKLATQTAPTADPGPDRERRQARANELSRATLFDEDTVLPAVPMWWRVLDPTRAQTQIDRLGSADIATDHGARILSNRSRLYDPLSYHYGSVWALFTGWASQAAYNYGRPHVGYQALRANVELTHPHALGYVTELLSGDFNTPFGRSSHHQVWSEAMVALPAVRGLLGLEAQDAGRTLRFAPRLPANWNSLDLAGVAAGTARYDLSLRRTQGRMNVVFTPRPPVASASATPATTANMACRIVFAPSLPADARVRSVTVNNVAARHTSAAIGDVQLIEIIVDEQLASRAPIEIVITYDEGTDIFVTPEPLAVGTRSRTIRVLRARADERALRLVVEGLGGATYELGVRSPARLSAGDGYTIVGEGTPDRRLRIDFGGTPGIYTRRELTVRLE